MSSSRRLVADEKGIHHLSRELSELITSEGEIKMKYEVSFQRFEKSIMRPIDHPSESDFSTDDSGMIPQVGDYVNIIATKEPKHAPAYFGRVRTRLFNYFSADRCCINIVIDPDCEDIWGELIKE